MQVRTTRLKWGFVSAVIFLSATATHAAEAFVLPYRAANHWVHKEDNKPLADLMARTSRTGQSTFVVHLPKDADRNLYTERLKILRNLLMGRTKNNIIIREVKGDSPPNTITVIPRSDRNY
jgi:hypothetical protein